MVRLFVIINQIIEKGEEKKRVALCCAVRAASSAQANNMGTKIECEWSDKNKISAKIVKRENCI